MKVLCTRNASSSICLSPVVEVFAHGRVCYYFGRVPDKDGVLVDAAIEAVGVSTATESEKQSQDSSEARKEDMQRSSEGGIPQRGNGEISQDSGSLRRASNPAIHDVMTRKKMSISALSNESKEKEKSARALPVVKRGRKRDCKKADLQQAVTDVLEIEGKKANTRSRLKKT